MNLNLNRTLTTKLNNWRTRHVIAVAVVFLVWTILLVWAFTDMDLTVDFCTHSWHDFRILHGQGLNKEYSKP